MSATVAPPLWEPASSRMRTLVCWGIGADSTGTLLRLLAAPERFGLLPDLSDLVVVHAVTGEEFRGSIDFAQRLVLPRLRAARVRLVQVCRTGTTDAEGITVLSDTRSAVTIHAAGPYRLGDEHSAAGTLPSLAGPHRCSIRFKGTVLDRWAAAEFGGHSFRRAIGYSAEEQRRADVDTNAVRLRAQSGGLQCVPWYPLIEWGWTRARVEAYVAVVTGERVSKSACRFCPYSGTAPSRLEQEARLRAEPGEAVRALLLEHRAVALNESSPLYGHESLAGRLAEDEANSAIVAAFRKKVAEGPTSVYEVRRVYTAARTPDCVRLHGKRCARPGWWCRSPRTPACRAAHGPVVPRCEGAPGCRRAALKGTAWRAVNAYWRGSRESCEVVVRLLAEKPGVTAVRGQLSGIVRAVYLEQAGGYPRAEGFFVAAPTGVVDKQRNGFEGLWTQVSGRQGLWSPKKRGNVLHHQELIS